MNRHKTVLIFFLLLMFLAVRAYSAGLIQDLLKSNDPESKEFVIPEPDTINDEVKILDVDRDLYPNGIKIIKLKITLPADAAYSMVFEEWSGDPPVWQNDIETVSTTASEAYKEVLEADIDDRIIDSGDHVFVDIPETDVDWIHCKIIYEKL